MSYINSSFSAEDDSVFKPYNFKMDEIDGFRYRAKVANFEIGRNVDNKVHCMYILLDVFGQSRKLITVKILNHTLY